MRRIAPMSTAFSLAWRSEQAETRIRARLLPKYNRAMASPLEIAFVVAHGSPLDMAWDLIWDFFRHTVPQFFSWLYAAQPLWAKIVLWAGAAGFIYYAVKRHRKGKRGRP